jgi:hypothetical protein
MGDQTPAATPLANPVAAAAPHPVRSEDSILAAIIAGINIPGTELGVGDRRMAVTSPPPIARAVPSRPLAAATSPAVGEAAHSSESKGGSGSSASRARIGEHKPVAKFEDEAEAPADRLTATRKPVTARKAVPGKAGKADAARGADGSAKGQRTDIDNAGDAPDKTEKTDKTSRKGTDARKAADAKKLADAKKAEEKRKNDPKLLEPQRYWVQVASGANANDLSKQWDKLKTKNGKALGTKSGWVAPQRASNRILTGPFKTSDEAQAFVNSLARQGVSGFVFASEAGQKVTKLPVK